jgi:hypothetical protein
VSGRYTKSGRRRRCCHCVTQIDESATECGTSPEPKTAPRSIPPNPALLCLPPRPPCFLALWSHIVHHGENKATCGLVAKGTLVVLDGCEWQRLAQARQGREPHTGTRKTPAASSCSLAASPSGTSRA